MKDSELYAQLLGLEQPWVVNRVELDAVGLEVLVDVCLERGVRQLSCPDCGTSSPLYDLSKERRWRHLDSCGFTTWLVARVPRVSCSQCGVHTASVPWSEPNSRYTLGFECFALRVLSACQVQSKTASLLRLSADEVSGIMERAVRRGQERRAQDDSQTPLPYLGLDEKSIQAGHNYLTILSDGVGQRVLEVAQGRTKEATCKLLEDGLSESQRTTVSAVSMDMWQSFAAACQQILPQAQIVHDRFHITQYLNKAVDDTRRQEHRRLSKHGRKENPAGSNPANESPNESPLVGTKYV